MKLRLREKIGYGFGDAASSMFWKLFSMYLMFYYTDIFGITAAAVGTMFLVTRIWDAAFDPFVGLLGDRTETRWGKFRPYLLWVAIPFGVIGVLTFTTPSIGAGGKLIYAYVTYSLMMMIYSLINVPYASLLGVMTADGRERTTLATFRFIFAFGGSLGLGGSQALDPNYATFINLGITPALDTFLVRRMSWGLAVPLSYTFAHTGDGSSLVGASPRIGYVFALGDRVFLWPRLSLDFVSATQQAQAPTSANGSNEETFHHRIVSTTLYVPAHARLLPNIALGIGPVLTTELLHHSDGGSHALLTTAGLQIEIAGWL